MSIKVIAIGNILMEDDGVGVAVAEKIKEELINKNIEVIIGETDIDHCISTIKEDDFIFIIDAACYGKEAGEVTIFSLEDYSYEKKSYSQHNYSLVDLIKLYYKSVKGYVICIEVNSISFKFGLSDVLESKIDIISQRVLDNIKIKVL